LERLLACFDPINLSEMEHVALLNRTDTKYVMQASNWSRRFSRSPAGTGCWISSMCA